MEILAKPSGVTLREHTNNVVREGHQIVDNYPFVIKKYQLLTGRSLTKRIDGACKFHDEGKKHSRWQNACRKDHNAFLDWKAKFENTFHEYERAIQNAGKNLMKANIRHEIDSVIRHPNLPLPIQVAIAAHHGKLSRFHESKWIEPPFLIDGSPEVWRRLRLLNSKFSEHPLKNFRQAVRSHYEYAGVRSLLRLADHRASIIETGRFVPDYVPFKYRFPAQWKKRPVQKIAENNWDNDLLLIRAPTGAGKTSAALLWAQKQIDDGRADRLVIAMPTRFTSNALAISVTENLSNTGLYHSSAWFANFHEQTKKGDTPRHVAKMMHEFARIFQTPVTVSTIDHLLICLTLCREDHHAITFNLANSCVVIDEADFYDDFTQANILVLLEILNELRVPVLIMSASLPISSLRMYQSTGFKVHKILEDNSDSERTRCKLRSKLKYDKVDDLETLLSRCTRQPTIIYANTVAKAVAFYDWFKENSNTEPMLYHSRFTEPDKLEKEKILLQNLGKQAWINGTARGIAILTQIGEMSINISANFMVSDVCPIDRLVQRAGRLARFHNKPGDLYVLEPQKDGKIYPAPYGRYNKSARQWEANHSLIHTLQLLQLKNYSARDLVQLINKIYGELDDFSVRAIANARILKESFVNNWIILPHAMNELDDTDTVFWKSRDIDNQISVLTSFPENPYFSNFLDWQAYKIEQAVDLPIYIVRQGIRNHKIDNTQKVYLKEDKEQIFCTYPGIYTKEKGLYFLPREPESQIL